MAMIWYSFDKWELPYLPTDRRARQLLREVVGIKETDRILDIGSGLGRMLVFFSRYPVEQVTGIEQNRWFCLIARIRLCCHLFKKGRVTIVNGSFYFTAFERYTILYAFLTPEVNSKLAPTLERGMQKNAVLISYQFRFHFSDENLREERIGNFYVYRRSGSGFVERRYTIT